MKQQDEYEGLIQISRSSSNLMNTSTNNKPTSSSTSSSNNHNTSLNGDANNTIHEEEDDEKKSPGTPSTPNGKIVNINKPQLVFRFGISSIVEKKEALLAGDKVWIFCYFDSIFIALLTSGSANQSYSIRQLSFCC